MMLMQNTSGFDLEKLYWMHVEYFPAHDAVNLKLSIHELIDIMVHGRTGVYKTQIVCLDAILILYRSNDLCHIHISL